MATQCFTWTTELLGSLFLAICKGEKDPGETFGRLPDYLVIDILSRLPAENLVRCRRDCMQLRALISSQYFTTLHLSRARPLLLMQEKFYSPKIRYDIYVFGEHLNNTKVFRRLHLRPKLMMNKNRKDPPVLRFTYQGVLLFNDPTVWSTYYVFNPITQQEVIVRHTLHPGYLCALYFCPVAREFKLLYAQERGSCYRYLVYIFKTRTWREIHSSIFNFLPRFDPPAVVNGALHWITLQDSEKLDIPPCANGIMVFGMGKEELSAMPHPGTLCNSMGVHRTMTLLVKENHLSFCHLLVPEYIIDIWILEDYEMWVWNKRYKICLSDQNIFRFSLPDSGSTPMDLSGWIRLFYIQDDVLLFYLVRRGLLFYNLDHKTVKRIDWQNESSAFHQFSPYIKSLLAIA